MKRTATLDATVAAALDEQQLPGIVALVTDANAVRYAGAVGQRGIDSHAPMTLDTLFWIASMTKALTATAAMQLIEQGHLTLETPASSLLPELADVQVLTGFDNAGQPALRPPSRAITVRHLLTHTAGFSYEMWNPLIARYREITGTPGTGDNVAAALQLPLVFDPGERWEYGINIDWLGRVIEVVSGQRLGAYMATAIFEPLGMHDTSFAPTPEQRTRLATMHRRRRDGTLTTLDFAPPTEPAVDMGGGGLYSTAPDYLRFLQMLLNRGRGNGQQILAPETVTLMAQNQIGDLTCRPMQSVKPGASRDVDFFPGMPQQWGLSFLINTATAAEGRAAGSLAWAGLGNTYFWIDPHRGVAGLFFTQLFPFFDAGAIAGFRAFETAVYQSLV